MSTNRLMPAIPLIALLGLAGSTAVGQGQDPAAVTNPALAAKAAPAPPTKEEQAIDAAIMKIRRIKSVTAKLKVISEMLALKFELDGEYAKAPDNRVRMLLTLGKGKLGDATGTLLQVCDATNLHRLERLWTYARSHLPCTDAMIGCNGLRQELRSSAGRGCEF